MLESPAAGTYSVTVLSWLTTPGGTYTGKATLTATPTGPPPDPKSVKWT